MLHIKPELVESLIPVDISTINNRGYNYVQNIIDALNIVNLNIEAPISQVRKLADEQIKCYVDVCTNMKILIIQI